MGIDELTQSWSYAVDLETYENAGKEAVHFVMGAVRTIYVTHDFFADGYRTWIPICKMRYVYGHSNSQFSLADLVFLTS